MRVAVDVSAKEHVLPGFEPDNLVAFLGLLGLLRALESERPEWHPRVSWQGEPPRAVLHLAAPVANDDIVKAAVKGMRALGRVYTFDRQDLKFAPHEFRALAREGLVDTERGRLLSALASDAILKSGSRDDQVQPTPLCTMFGQGHQHFLGRLMAGVSASDQDTEQALRRALFDVWRYEDDLSHGFRWDPFEDRRHAYRFDDPSRDRGNSTERGANMLAAVGFAALTSAPTATGLATVGVSISRRGAAVSVCWPLVGLPATFVGHMAPMAHPWLSDPEKAARLKVYGVRAVVRARRIQVDRYFNFERGTVQFLE